MIRRIAFALLSGIVVITGGLSFIKSELFAGDSASVLAHVGTTNACVNPESSTVIKKNEGNIMFVTCGGYLD
jgi:hypothetical protein